MIKKKIAVIGGDKRQIYLSEMLAAMGYCTEIYGVNRTENRISLEDALEGAYAAVLPYPVSPDGVYLNAFCDECDIKLTEFFIKADLYGIRKITAGGLPEKETALLRELGIEFYDFGKSESLMRMNALCTAEGAIELAMKETPFLLQGSTCTVIGYGRIGALLSKRLQMLGANVKVCARRRETLAQINADGLTPIAPVSLQNALTSSDIVFNTAASLVLDRDALQAVRCDTLIIDLASPPGGVDFNEAEKLGLKVIWALSLPGKYSPKSAAQIICDDIAEFLETPII